MSNTYSCKTCNKTTKPPKEQENSLRDIFFLCESCYRAEAAKVAAEPITQEQIVFAVGVFAIIVQDLYGFDSSEQVALCLASAVGDWLHSGLHLPEYLTSQNINLTTYARRFLQHAKKQQK
jgi:hypothetical protein